MTMKPEVQRRKQRARERQMCPVHSYETHGKEAEELRRGVESIIRRWAAADNPQPMVMVLEELGNLLDRVDARDSLAYLERCDVDVKRRRRP